MSSLSAEGETKPRFQGVTSHVGGRWPLHGCSPCGKGEIHLLYPGPGHGHHWTWTVPTCPQCVSALGCQQQRLGWLSLLWWPSTRAELGQELVVSCSSCCCWIWIRVDAGERGSCACSLVVENGYVCPLGGHQLCWAPSLRRSPRPWQKGSCTPNCHDDTRWPMRRQGCRLPSACDWGSGELRRVWALALGRAR